MKMLAEIAYFCEDVQEMAAFYRILLDREPIAASEQMAIFVIEGTKIFLHRTYEAGEGELPPEDHTAYAAADVDAACQAMIAQGLVIETPPRDYYWGRSAYLRDPEGHLIELTGETPQ